MVTTEQLLTTSSLSRTIDRIKPVRSFLTRLIMGPGTTEILQTETAELSTYEGDAETAPFIRKNGRSVQVGGDSQKFATIETPNIRISHPIEPSRLLTDRHPGQRIFLSAGEGLTPQQRYIARMQSRLRERIDNTTEWMVAQLLRGQISYQTDDGANFQVTLPRLAAHNITLSSPANWNNASATGIKIYEDFDLAKSLVSEEEGGQITHALMGDDAAKYFLRNSEVRELLKKDSGIATGDIDLRRQYQADGGLYLGNFCGVECWKYPRKLNVEGTSTSLLRSSHVEFISSSSAAETIMYYGMILDMEAFSAREHVGRFYSKSWTSKDPSNLMLLAHSRPLPWFARPNMFVSMDVII